MPESMKHDNARIEWIDNAKFVGIYLVILGHLKLNVAGPTNIIFSFHMPLFFMLSGLTFHPSSLKKSLQSVFRQLLIPYAAIYLITYIWWLFVSFPRHPELYGCGLQGGLVKPLLGMLFGVGYDTACSTMTNIPLWFLIGLAWCRLVAALSMRLFEKRRIVSQILLSMIFIGVSILLSKEKILPLFSLGPLLMVYPFFALGVMIQPFAAWEPPASAKVKLCVGISIMAIAAALNALIVRINGRVDVNSMVFGKAVLLFYLGALFGICAVVCLSRMIKRNVRYFRYLSRNTLVILGFHGIITSCIVYILKTKIHYDEQNATVDLWAGCVISFVNILLCGIPAFVMNKYFPMLIGSRKRIQERESSVSG